MKHRDLKKRLSKLEAIRPRDKPYMVILNHDEPTPPDYDDVLVIRGPDPNAPKSTIDNPARLPQGHAVTTPTFPIRPLK